MWHELIVELEAELDDLAELQSEYSELLMKATLSEPGKIEVLALANILQSFYTGIENALTRILKTFGASINKSSSWHTDLLRDATAITINRPAIIDDKLAERLRPYLGFRHVARAQYGFRLDWNRMEGLVRDLPETATEFDRHIRTFLFWLES